MSLYSVNSEKVKSLQAQNVTVIGLFDLVPAFSRWVIYSERKKCFRRPQVSWLKADAPPATSGTAFWTAQAAQGMRSNMSSEFQPGTPGHPTLPSTIVFFSPPH